MQSLRTLRLSIVSKRDRVLHKFSWSSTTTTTNANNSTLLFQNQRQPSQHTQFEDIISSYSTLSSENNSNSNNNNSNSKTNTTTPSPTSSSTTTPENNNNNHSGFKLFILNIYGHIRKFADELNQQVKHGVIAYYTNWKFYKDIIRPKQMMGTPLSRQEIISMNNFKKDSLYFVPLFVYLCVPFSTFGLPIYIKYLSAILPSTFSTREMIVKRYLNKLKKRTKHANSLYERLKSRDDILPNQKITLSNLNRGDLVLLYKCIGFSFTMTSTDNIIENIIQWEKEIIHDNKVILREGIQNLSIEDLQDIAFSRGIHFIGKSYDQLLQQLSQSLIISPSSAPSHSSCALSVMNSLLSTHLTKQKQMDDD